MLTDLVETPIFSSVEWELLFGGKGTFFGLESFLFQ
jgi:hypothetical protein